MQAEGAGHAQSFKQVGSLASTGDFKHITVDMFLIEEDGEKKLKVEYHSARRKQLASLRTVITHVKNLITGVTKGFEYKLRLVYAHFPININIEQKGTIVEIRNFLGEKRVRVVKMLPGCTIARSEGVKDELIVQGNSIENVSRSCALIGQSCLVK
jgi:large subunit ribosomal protein L9e